MRRLWLVGLALLGLGAMPCVSQAQSEAAILDAPEAFEKTLETLRAKHRVPALAAAVIENGKVIRSAAVGFRKEGDPTRVTVNDQFHIGSITKAMTATLIAKLVEENRLRWNQTLGESFPNLRETMQPDYRNVTLLQLLSHHGGMPAESYPGGVNWWIQPGTPSAQRAKYVEVALRDKPEKTPGTAFLYANRGYIVAGAILERATGKSWESVIQERLFKPLGMKSAGFGPMGTPGKIDQPWQHVRRGDKLEPIPPNPQNDNAVVLGPAGRVHCSIGDLAKFAILQLTGSAGKSRFLRQETFQKLQTPPYTQNYALGIGTVERGWAGGKALSHAGSNTQNFAVFWLAPERNFGVVVATNAGGDEAAQACDAVSGAVVTELAARFARRPASK